MKELWIEVVGTYAILMNNPVGMSVVPDKPAGATTKPRNPTPAEEAESKCYRMASGQLYAKSEMFRSAMIDAVTGLKYGSKVFAKPTLMGGLFDEQELCPLYDPETRAPITEYEIDTRRAVVQGNGVSRSRAKVRRWACQVRFLYDPDTLTPELILDAAQRAGMRVGIMDFRPKPPPGPKSGKGGPFGRFSVALLLGGERVTAA